MPICMDDLRDRVTHNEATTYERCALAEIDRLVAERDEMAVRIEVLEMRLQPDRDPGRWRAPHLARAAEA